MQIPTSPCWKRVAVKIGSNVLTRKDGTLDVTRMSSLVDQVAALRKSGVEVIMISSGAVASGRSELQGSVDIRLDSVGQRQLYSAVGQAKLINRYYELFREHHLAVGQVLTMKENFSTRRHYLNQRQCMEIMLDAGVIPIVNENDTVSVTELMFTDNDELSGLIATMLHVDALVILSNISGLFTGNPADPDSKLIETVMPGDDLSGCVIAGRSGFGRGGMTTKCNIARRVAREGIEVVIACGTESEILTRLCFSPESVGCTRFVPSDNAVPALKRWMAHSSDFAKGVITINSQAAERLTGPDPVSLLPVGVIDVKGNFEKDDLVDVATPDGHVIALGRAACDSRQAIDDMGCHDRRPIIHYDYLYIYEQS
ncbi:MAG: glutamate 5-kinase [Paramuribaculum sp.]|nr:glutamate 5-kinase [Paramuribaculum sp.]